jgi:hypothetical protein
MHEDRKYLLNLADRIDRSADELAAEAADPRGTLESRGWHLTDDEVTDYGARKEAAAATARQYAKDLRAEANSGTGAVAAERVKQAETVETAARCGGTLIDSRGPAEATATADNAHIWHPADKEAWEAGEHPAQTKAAAVEGSGVFEHVAETINGVEQVPFWQLGRIDQAQHTAEPESAGQSAAAEAAPAAVDDDTDGA